MEALLDGELLPPWQPVELRAGARLSLGAVKGGGARAYLAVRGGVDVPEYLGSRSTFTLGQFGGHAGRPLRTGDVLHVQIPSGPFERVAFDPALVPAYGALWTLRVVYGPHGAPDFFTDADIDRFFATDWEVHYNSSRTGVRLIGPKPEWARPDGGEAGLHPCNIHDNAYAIGTVDFTGNMPVILGPDGPSLGGFVCPATLVRADLWITGQLRPGDRLRFVPVDQSEANRLEVPARIVHLPLAWDDSQTRLAIAKYEQSVRKDAPWCPSNIEFIRRINGLDSIEAVKRIVFEASYLVMGLGDVYLGAPVATPMDPRHRLVTTKYNPARTWTPENAVGIGGSYLCVYGMEGPGGYQFVGRTVQMWNRYRCTPEFEQPWLLRFFDQVRFYETTEEALLQAREDFPRGRFELEIEETRFRLRNYNRFLADHADSVRAFKTRQQAAFEAERERWRASGQARFETPDAGHIDESAEELRLAEGEVALESHVHGSVWQVEVREGDRTAAGQVAMVLESMKMEISLHAAHAGRVARLLASPGSQVSPGQPLLVIDTRDAGINP